MQKLWRHCCAVLGSGGLAAFSGIAQADKTFNAVTPATRISAASYDLHMQMMYWALAIFGIAFGLMLYSVYRHHQAVARKPAQFHRNATVEIIWTIIPLIIVLALIWPAAKTVMGLNDTSNVDIIIKATGMQWKWGYDYLNGDGQGVTFFSNLYAPTAQALTGTPDQRNSYLLDVDNPVVVPVNKKIRMILTADEVLHSWHVPGLGVKQDVIPGFNRDTWFHAQEIGTYRGLCSVEACGVGRACVLIVVNVVSDADYKTWVDGKKNVMATTRDKRDHSQGVTALAQRGAD